MFVTTISNTKSKDSNFYTNYKATRSGPDHSLSGRQQRKLDGRLSGRGFARVYFEPHKHGPRRARRAVMPEARGKAVVSGRVKARRRGEYCGRKLERLIRSGAPLREVARLRREIRDFLTK